MQAVSWLEVTAGQQVLYRERLESYICPKFAQYALVVRCAFLMVSLALDLLPVMTPFVFDGYMWRKQQEHCKVDRLGIHSPKASPHIRLLLILDIGCHVWIFVIHGFSS